MVSLRSSLLALAACHIAVILLFTRGFLLTRVELPHTSSCSGGTLPKCPPQRYDKAVVLVVDALRYDFTCAPVGPAKPHHGLFPRTLERMARAVSWAHARQSSDPRAPCAASLWP